MKRHVPRLGGRAAAFAKTELVGLEAAVVRSTDPGLVGLHGVVVDETLHTLTLRTGSPGGRRVQVAKAACTFAFQVPGQDPVVVEGRAIEFRSEDRTKKVR
jgi:ribonuclease P protein subunit POP4